MIDGMSETTEDVDQSTVMSEGVGEKVSDVATDGGGGGGSGDNDDDDNDDDDDDDDDRVSMSKEVLDEESQQHEFLTLIRQCRASEVTRFLEANQLFDVNCKDYRGMTGLNLAIEVNCPGIVDALLAHPNVDVGDGLMHAVRYGHHAIVVQLLDMLESRGSPQVAQTGYSESSEFPEHLTPIMLAAQCGHYRIIATLLKRGHTIAVPHKARCLCKEVCKSDKRLDNGLGAAELKISVYRALTNPAYISLTSEDPILTAFQLSKELREHGQVDRMFKADYESLDAQTRLFAVRLIGLCESADEVDTVLTRREGCTFFGPFAYHRLILAMDLRQKEFVAHANVQHALELAWMGDWYEWRRRGTAYKAAAALTRIALLPYVVLLYLALPYSRAGRHYALPVNRMLNYMATYVVFLLTLSCENNAAKDAAGGFGVLRCVIVVYALSFAYRTVKLALVQGPRRHFGMLWNVYDCVTLAALAATIVCWWQSFRDGPPTDTATGAPLPRERWPAANPALLSEGLLAVTTVMAWLRALFMCQLSHALGPMQVSLGKMTTDFARFALLFGIVLLAFTAGLCTLYQYYEGMARTDPITGLERKQDESFVNVYATLKTLFWGLFCMSPATSGTVVVEAALADVGHEETAADGHYFTQAVGTALYASFMVLSVVVMMNMLVASMTNTYQRVTGNAYVEWLFGRTKVLLSFAVHTELPPPMNFIPSADCVTELCACAGRVGAAGFAKLVTRAGSRSIAYTREDFRKLMSLLVRRYFRDRLSNGFNYKCKPACTRG